MSMQDPVADMLTSIRNAQLMGIQKVRVPHSNLKCEILKVLKDEGFIQQFETELVDNKKNIHIALKYFQGKPVIERIDRISKPSLHRFPLKIFQCNMYIFFIIHE